MKIIAATLAMTLAMAAGTAEGKTTKEQAITKAKSMVKQLGSGLKGELQSAVKKSGFAGAVTACGEIAQAKAEQISQDNSSMIHRVSLKTRNPANTPDDYERARLQRMERDLANGALKKAYVEVVMKDGAKSLRFMKPILTSAFCLNCHGAESKIKPGVAAILSRLYPEDKARGYKENQVRGAFSVTVPMDR
ncbi:MAG: DUF3365 domain-containing protein [Nitrospinota bacterium]|nr:DUF3365 domain-containing protein [Nitrospinota bacterium]